MNQSTQRYPRSSGSADDGPLAPVSRPRTASKKSKKKNSRFEPMSSWGCLLWSVVFTLVLFAVYVFFGLLLDAVQ